MENTMQDLGPDMTFECKDMISPDSQVTYTSISSCIIAGHWRCFEDSADPHKFSQVLNFN